MVVLAITLCEHLCLLLELQNNSYQHPCNRIFFASQSEELQSALVALLQQALQAPSPSAELETIT